MPYSEYDNTIMVTSHNLCIPPMVRNSGVVFMQDIVQNIADPNVRPLDGSGIQGIVTMMTENEGDYDDVCAGSVVRNENYIYLPYAPIAQDGSSNFYVMEYNLETEEIITVLVEHFYHGTYGYTGHPHIAFVKDRKILYWAETGAAMLGVAPNRYHYDQFFSVDFETEEVTEELEWLDWWESAAGSDHHDGEWETYLGNALMTVKMPDGHVWGFFIGDNYYMVPGGTYLGGVTVYFKDFDSSPAEWQVAYAHTTNPSPEPPNELDYGWEANLVCNPIVVGHDKIVMCSYVGAWGSSPIYTNWGCEIFIFDLNTHELTATDVGEGMGRDYSLMVYDIQSNMIYVTDDYYTGDGGNCISAFDLDTYEWTANIFGDTDSEFDWDIYLLSSEIHAYFYLDQTQKLYQANGLDTPIELGTIPSIGEQRWWDCSYSSVVESPEPNIVLFDYSDASPSNWRLRRIKTDGTILNDYNLGFTTDCRYHLIQMFDCYVIIEDIYFMLHQKYHLIS